MSPPCLPRWEEVPQMMSSTSSVFRLLRWASAARTVAARCCGWCSASAPLPTLPIPRGVRQASMIRASGIGGSSFSGRLRRVGQGEDTLGDDVVLDLERAAVDRHRLAAKPAAHRLDLVAREAL